LRNDLISSPVEIFLNMMSVVSILPYVPFPTPGAPNKRILGICVFFAKFLILSTVYNEPQTSVKYKQKREKNKREKKESCSTK